mgnify:CR=1 FL=1
MRYDVFQMIFEMILDNILLRVKQNKLSSRILSQSQLNIDKTINTYFKASHNTHQKAILFAQMNFEEKLDAAKK